ncbi:hypothetical protein AeMF1_003404 [Aphanomyces euteiches]|nr:hypothetical protein AeMF1_003404 [Aphanomyces euteiches]KAH9189280.1 hypothetical protein AeNC1_008736 [Aphanomyces euteiches]
MTAPIHKRGLLFKKGSGQGLLNRQNWKRRVFELTRTELNYYDTNKSSTLKGSLDLTTCRVADLEIMPADCTKTGNSDSSEWRIAIQTPSRRFVFATATEDEMHEWATALRAIFAANERYLIHDDGDYDQSNTFINRYLERLAC